MKTFNNLCLIAISILLTSIGCSENISYVEERLDSLPKEERTFTLTASALSTRISLTEETDNRITLSWEENDVVQLVFVQAEIKKSLTVMVSNISDNGKNAQFIFNIPDEINDGTFDLYGVYGGGGISIDDPTLAILPEHLGAAESLTSVEERKDAMLFFSEKGVQTSDPRVNVTFEHLGSLFSLSLKNSSDNVSLENIAEARIKGPEGVNWAHNFGEGGGTYDLENGLFTATNPTGEYISFKSPENSLSPGGTITFWAWYPPHPDLIWPNLGLELRDSSGDLLYASVNSHSPRSTPTASGKSYYFFAEWDGTALQFTDQNGTITKNIYELYDINLGAQLNTEYGQFVNIETGSVHKVTGVANISETIDIISFRSGSTGAFAMVAPTNSTVAQNIYNPANSGEDALGNWPTRNNTVIKLLPAEFTNLDFEAVGSYEEIKTLFDSTGGGSDTSGGFQNGRSIVIRTADDRYALIHKRTTPVNTASGYMTVHIKAQK